MCVNCDDAIAQSMRSGLKDDAAGIASVLQHDAGQALEDLPVAGLVRIMVGWVAIPNAIDQTRTRLHGKRDVMVGGGHHRTFSIWTQFTV